MPLFRLEENGYIYTDHIADIASTPLKPTPVVMMPRLNPEDEEMPFPAKPSRLNIELKHGEEISPQAEEADQAWAAFKEAKGAGSASDG